MIFTLWSQDDYSYRFHVVVFYLCGRLERVDLLHYSHHPIPLMFVQNTQVTKQVYTHNQMHLIH